MHVDCRHRIGEVLTAFKLLSSISQGQDVPGLVLTGGLNPKTLLQGTFALIDTWPCS